MNFEDETLVRLAGESTRSEVFDQIALEQMVSAVYDTEGMGVQGVNEDGEFRAIFDELQLGVAIPRMGVLEGAWAIAGTNEKTEARFQTSGLGGGDLILVDALWRGAIVARTAPSTSEIIQVEITWPDLASIDPDIIAALGALPVDPEDLEQARRDRLLAILEAALAPNTAVAGAMLDQWLSRVDVSTVGELLTELQPTEYDSVVRVGFSEPEDVPSSPMRLPIVAALLIRNSLFPLAQFLVESKAIREQLESIAVLPTTDPALKLRHPFLVVWIIPATEFDDTDWPAGDDTSPELLNSERRTVAGRWLAREGIGLVVVPQSS